MTTNGANESGALSAAPLSPENEAALEASHQRKAHTAALILEVLAGERSSGEAARELGVSLTRYYILEKRAVEGLMEACAPRPRGPGRSAEREILRLKEEVKRLQSQCRRTANLLRLSQRGLGVSPSDSTRSESSKRSARKTAKKTSGKRRRRRSGKARALTLAKKLRSENPKGLDVSKRDGENPGEVKSTQSGS